MTTARGSLRIPLLIVAIAALIAVVAIPALAASPSPSAGGAGAGPAASGLAASEKPGKSQKPGKGPKAPKVPEVEVTLRGVVAKSTDANGKTTYTLTANGKTVRLDAGPSWFFGDKHPLAPFVGKTVTIAGGQRGNEVDVETVDGTRLRAEGKPPWAGGWKAVGSAHPGWTQEKVDRWAAHQAAKAARKAEKATGTKAEGPDGSDEPEESPEPSGG